MAQASNSPTAEFTQLLKDLQSLQSALDQVMIAPDTPRAILSAIQKTLVKEAVIFVMLGCSYSEDAASRLAHTAPERNSNIINNLRSIPETRSLDLSAISRLPPPGSPGSRAILLWTHLLNKYSQVLQAQTSSTQDPNPQCSHCVDKITIGQRYVQLPCMISHKLHETCLTECASRTYVFKCRFCNTTPFVPFQ